jgi:alcohol dehydrogenase class IV
MPTARTRLNALAHRHGLGNALLLAAATRFNAEVRAYEFSRIAAALGCDATPEAAIAAVRRLAHDLDIPANCKSPASAKRTCRPWPPKPLGSSA